MLLIFYISEVKIMKEKTIGFMMILASFGVIVFMLVWTIIIPIIIFILIVSIIVTVIILKEFMTQAQIDMPDAYNRTYVAVEKTISVMDIMAPFIFVGLGIGLIFLIFQLGPT